MLKETIKIQQTRKITQPNLCNPEIKRSQKSSIVFSKKTDRTPMLTLDKSQSEISEQQREQFLMLQIKLLKRQNNFLKKKLNQLRIQFDLQQPKKTKHKQKQKISLQNIQILPLSLDIFFGQIQNLLNTIVNLFKVDLSKQQIKKYQQINKEQLEKYCPIKKFQIFKKSLLKKKLQRISLQEQEKRYSLFIDLFSQFYQYKQQSQKKTISIVDSMTEKAHYLNNLVIQKVKEKKRRKSAIFSPQKRTQTQRQYNLLVPPTRSFKSSYHLNTYSVQNRNIKSNIKFHRSPCEKNNKY